MATDSTAAPDIVRLFTDGACSGSPGPGGWAYILKHPASGRGHGRVGAEPRDHEQPDGTHRGDRRGWPLAAPAASS